MLLAREIRRRCRGLNVPQYLNVTRNDWKPARQNVSLLTLNIHDHGNAPVPVAIRRLAVVSPVAAPRHWHFQIENMVMDDGVRGSLAKPSEGGLWAPLGVAVHRFRDCVDGDVYYFPRDRHVFRGNWREEKKEAAVYGEL